MNATTDEVLEIANTILCDTRQDWLILIFPSKIIKSYFL